MLDQFLIRVYSRSFAAKPVLASLCGFNSLEQDLRFRHSTLGFIAKHRPAVYQDGQIAPLSRLDLRLDAEFRFCCLLQAHGCMAQVESKETTLDFDVHRIFVLKQQMLMFRL